MASNEQNLDIKQAAKRIGVSRTSLDRIINRGEIAICRVRGRVLIPESIVNKFILCNLMIKTKGTLCPSESVEISGESVFKRAAKGSKEVLDRLLRGKTH